MKIVLALLALLFASPTFAGAPADTCHCKRHVVVHRSAPAKTVADRRLRPAVARVETLRVERLAESVPATATATATATAHEGRHWWAVPLAVVGAAALAAVILNHDDEHDHGGAVVVIGSPPQPAPWPEPGPSKRKQQSKRKH